MIQPPTSPLPPQPPPSPTRPEADTLGRERRWLPALALAVVVLVVVFGGYVVAAALSEPAGRPISVAGVVRIHPLSGWRVAGRFSGAAGVRLTRGGGNLDVRVLPFQGPAVDLLSAYVEQALKPEGRVSVSGQLESITLASGAHAVRVSYVGLFGRGQTAIEGEVTAVVAPDGIGVVFDAWAPQGLLGFVSGDVHAMIETAEVA